MSRIVGTIVSVAVVGTAAYLLLSKPKVKIMSSTPTKDAQGNPAKDLEIKIGLKKHQYQLASGNRLAMKAGMPVWDVDISPLEQEKEMNGGLIPAGINVVWRNKLTGKESNELIYAV